MSKAAWLVLALIHVSPAGVAIAPRLLRRLYGVEPNGDVGVLLAHRGVLFVSIFVACVFAIVDPHTRRAASVVVGLSVVGFLVLYRKAPRTPSGPLRKIAIVDAIALGPLAWVSWDAWR